MGTKPRNTRQKATKGQASHLTGAGYGQATIPLSKDEGKRVISEEERKARLDRERELTTLARDYKAEMERLQQLKDEVAINLANAQAAIARYQGLLKTDTMEANKPLHQQSITAETSRIANIQAEIAQIDEALGISTRGYQDTQKGLANLIQENLALLSPDVVKAGE